MPDITSQLLKRNLGAAVVKTVGAAELTIPYVRSDANYVIFVENGDAAACRVKFLNSGYGGEGLPDLDVDIAAGEFAAVGELESMLFKAPSDQKVTLQVLDQDDAAFSGTVTNVTFIVFELPKALTN